MVGLIALTGDKDGVPEEGSATTTHTQTFTTSLPLLQDGRSFTFDRGPDLADREVVRILVTLRWVKFRPLVRCFQVRPEDPGCVR